MFIIQLYIFFVYDAILAYQHCGDFVGLAVYILQRGSSPILGSSEKLAFLWTLTNGKNSGRHLCIALNLLKDCSDLSDKSRLKDLHLDFSVDIKLKGELVHRESVTGS